MPLYLIERSFAERIESSAEEVGRILEVNRDVGVHWLFSFLSADKRKSYCLYEAPGPEALREAARLLGLPIDVIVEVSPANALQYLPAREVEAKTGRPVGDRLAALSRSGS